MYLIFSESNDDDDDQMMDRGETQDTHAAVISPASNLDIGSNCEGLGRIGALFRSTKSLIHGW